MTTLKLLAAAFSICLFASCTPRNSAETKSEENEPAVPGVGIAPDSSNAVKDSTIQKQQADTAAIKQQ